MRSFFLTKTVNPQVTVYANRGEDAMKEAIDLLESTCVNLLLKGVKLADIQDEPKP
jgi:hypothetical protein